MVLRGTAAQLLKVGGLLIELADARLQSSSP
jgi:hypothetical protein